MRRYTSSASRYPRKVVPPYNGGVGTVSGEGWLDGDHVTIPSGTTIILDCETPSLASLTIQGTLVANQLRDCGITAGNINIGSTGTFQIGSRANPYRKKATITLTGAEVNRTERFVADVSASSGTGNGVLSRLFTGSGTVAETVTVTFSDATNFTVSGSVSGSLGSGTVGTLFNNRVRFIATAGTTAWTNGATRTITVVRRGFNNNGVGRSIQVQPGGRLILEGNPPSVVRTTVAAHIAPGQSTLQTAIAVGWGRGDNIVIGPTDFYGTTSGTPEKLISRGAYGTSAVVAGAVSRAKWGVLQYVTDAGMSLTPGTLTNTENVSTPAWEAIPKVLDQRAPVINLSRNIVIQGVADDAWRVNGFGAHVMIMGLNSVAQVNGVEFRRVGQAGANGRYPFHWHVLSYEMPDGFSLPSNGTFIGQANPANHFLTNSSIHTSAQRAIVIHGTHGVLVDRNVCFDIVAHAIFVEDGAEKNNTITDNTVIKVRNSTALNMLIDSDRSNEATGGASGIWYTNPANTLTGNWASDCEGVGVWNSFASKCHGLCQDVAETPRDTNILLHHGNMSHSCQTRGMMTEGRARNNAGTIELGTYIADGTATRFEMTGAIVWKNNGGGYLNRVRLSSYQGWTQADNAEQDFSGAATSTSVLSEGKSLLCIGESLNNSTSRTTRRNAFASYHELMNFKDSVVVNYPYQPPAYTGPQSVQAGGGVVRLNDIYIESITRMRYFTKLKRVNSHSGPLVPPPHIDGDALNSRHWTMSGALHDLNGLWAAPGRYLIHDHPFLTYQAADLQPVAGGNGRTTTTPYMGIEGLRNPGPTPQGYSITPMDIRRLDSSNVPVPGAEWIIADGATSVLFPGMRHFAVAVGGRYRFTYPDITVDTHTGFTIKNVVDASSTFVIALKWNSATVSNAWIKSTGSNRDTVPTAGEISSGVARMLTSAPDLATVEAAPGNRYWNDTANGLLWIKFVGGLTDGGQWTPPQGDLDKNHYFRANA